MRRRLSMLLAAVTAVACLAGCDQLSSLIGGGKESKATASTAAAPPAAVTPAAPIVLPSDVVATVNGAPISDRKSTRLNSSH